MAVTIEPRTSPELPAGVGLDNQTGILTDVRRDGRTTSSGCRSTRSRGWRCATARSSARRGRGARARAVAGDGRRLRGRRRARPPRRRRPRADALRLHPRLDVHDAVGPRRRRDPDGAAPTRLRRHRPDVRAARRADLELGHGRLLRGRRLRHHRARQGAASATPATAPPRRVPSRWCRAGCRPRAGKPTDRSRWHRSSRRTSTRSS